MSPAEIVASLLGVANIVLLVRRSIWNYPFGLAMVAIYATVFAEAKLYSDALLQIFFFASQLYGWIAWARAGGGDAPIAVRRMPIPGRLIWLVGAIALSLLWGAAMARFTDAAYPLWDGGVAIFSIAAQLLLARRYLENWLVWIAVDAVAIALYAARGLYLTAGLYILFFVFAIAGFVEWKRAEGAALR